MDQISVVRRVQFVLLATAFVVTLVITPKSSFDSVNLPKQVALAVGALSSLSLLLIVLRTIAHKLLFLFTVFFCFWIILVLFFSGSSVTMQFWGTFGRNTGALTYICLCIILFCASEVFTASFGKKILYLLVLVGLVNAVYALLQAYDLDFLYSELASQYKVFGTTGNPNFLSALLGMSALSIASLAFARDIGLRKRVVYTLLFFVVFCGLSVSASRQGFAVLILGMVILIFLKFVRSKNRFVSTGYLLTLLASGALGLMGFLQRGPLSSILYENTISLRGYYWKAGLEMALANPFFGVGMDMYGNWFRSVRDPELVTKYGALVQANSAHNVFLDIASSGGFLLLGSYLCMTMVILFCAVKLVLRAKQYDSLDSGLIVVWLAWLAQSIVSINQISVAIWGWILGGAIVGRYLYSDRELPNRNDYVAERITALAALAGIAGLLTGLLLGLPLFMKDVEYRGALGGKKLERVIEVSQSFPANDIYLSQTAEILRTLNYNSEAMLLAKEAIEVNPRSFPSWNLIFYLSPPDSTNRRQAQKQLSTLDPYYALYQEQIEKSAP